MILLSLYVPAIEKELQMTPYSKLRMDLMLDNESLEYVKMVLGGTMQDYLDKLYESTQGQLRDYTKRLSERFSPNIAEDIAREFLMYGQSNCHSIRLMPKGNNRVTGFCKNFIFILALFAIMMHNGCVAINGETRCSNGMDDR